MKLTYDTEYRNLPCVLILEKYNNDTVKVALDLHKSLLKPYLFWNINPTILENDLRLDAEQVTRELIGRYCIYNCISSDTIYNILKENTK